MFLMGSSIGEILFLLSPTSELLNADARRYLNSMRLMSLNWNSFCCGKMLGMDVMGEEHYIHKERDRERESDKEWAMDYIGVRGKDSDMLCVTQIYASSLSTHWHLTLS